MLKYDNLFFFSSFHFRFILPPPPLSFCAFPFLPFKGMSAQSAVGGGCFGGKLSKLFIKRADTFFAFSPKVHQQQQKGTQLPIAAGHSQKGSEERDEHSKLFGHRFLNSQLSLCLGAVQLLFCLWALTQHIWSMASLKKILHCDFSPNSTLPPLLTHVDAIIFDIGLFHNLWGISGCVAQHLDGGYGRFCWCIVHSAALLFCLPLAFVSRPKPRWLWPLLIQSAYGVGMLILSLAALPRAAHFLGDLSNAPLKAIFFYSLGTLMNFFLLYIYWHWYWHVETMWNSARKLRRGETFAGSTTKRPIRRYSPIVVGGNATFLGMSPKGTNNGTVGKGAAQQMTTPKGRTLANGGTMSGGRGGGTMMRAEETDEDNKNSGRKSGRTHPLTVGDTYGNHSADVSRRQPRRTSLSPRGLDGHKSPLNWATNSFSSTTASSSIVSTTTSSTTQQQLMNESAIKKPPPPAPFPAAFGNDQSQANCFTNSHHLSLPNKLTLSPRVRHLRREGFRHIQHNQKHFHANLQHTVHCLRCSNGRFNICASVDGTDFPLTVRSVPPNCETDQRLQPKSNGPTLPGDGAIETVQIGRRLIRQRNLLKCESWRPEKGLDQQSSELVVENGLIDQKSKLTPNEESHFWTETVGRLWPRDSDGVSDLLIGMEANFTARGRGALCRNVPNEWSPSARYPISQKRALESSLSTSWSSTKDRLSCHPPTLLRWHPAGIKEKRTNALTEKRSLGAPIRSLPLSKRTQDESGIGWSASWSDSPSHCTQRISPAGGRKASPTSALFTSSPLGMFGLSTIFGPSLEHRV